MPFIKNVLWLIEQKHISKNKMLKDLGMGTGTFATWEKRGTIPSGETLSKIAKYFDVSVDSLLSDIITCEDCEFTYSPNVKADIESHQYRHLQWEKAKDKFGIWNYAQREERYEYEQYEKDAMNPFEKRVEAAKKRIFAYFSRSVIHSDYNLSHISFIEYIPYLLSSQKQIFSPDIYEALVTRYGIKSGMRGTDWQCNPIKKQEDMHSRIKENIIPNAIPIREMHPVPILGKIRAGYGLTAVENIIGYMNTEHENYNDCFWLQVEGQSMEPRIFDGDYVLIDKEAVIENGDIVAVIVDGEDGTVKKYEKQNNAIVLKPLNPDCETRVFVGKEQIDILIVGRVVEIKAII